MKKVIVIAFAILLLLSSVHFTRGAKPIKVLVDESKVFSWNYASQEYLIEKKGFSRDTDWSFSFKNEDECWGFSRMAGRVEDVASLHIKESGEISYSHLSRYDVLIIASLGERYSSEEMDAIKKFVENGGGLLFLAGQDFPNNSFSRAFDVVFTEDVVIADKNGVSKKFEYKDSTVDPERANFFYVDFVTSHPITEDVRNIGVCWGIPISRYETGTVLAKTSRDSWADEGGTRIGTKQPYEKEGPFDILLVMEIGKGRAVFVGSGASFWNAVTKSERQNLYLITNAVEWLGEPGGPYKQSRRMNEQAQQRITDAVFLYTIHKFSEAKEKFEEAITIFEESNEVHSNSTAREGIEDANAYILKCETGMEAEETFEEALDLLESEEYDNAVRKFKRAKSLYEKIDYTERATECNTRTEAILLFQEAQHALEWAPSTFDTARYEEARSLFEQCRSKWEECDDLKSVYVCEEKIEQCDEEIARIERNRTMAIGAAVGTVIVVAVVAVALMARRKPEAPEPEAPEPKITRPLKALSERYAKGEITKEEYEEIKLTLEED